jgi:hypothetical protein
MSQTIVIHVELFMSLESFPCIWVYQLGLRLFWVTTCKLLIIQPFCQWKWHKIEIKTILEFWGILGVIQSCQQVRFNKVYSTIFKAKVWKILMFEWILLLEFQKNYKNWVWKEKISWALNMFTLPNLEFFILRMFKINNVFTHLGQWDKLH